MSLNGPTPKNRPCGPCSTKELSEAVRGFVPVGLASLSDRLGNIVVQLPVTVLVAKFGGLRESGDLRLTVAWHPKATARPLRASCTMNYDDAIPAFSSLSVAETETLLPMNDGPGLHRAMLWDDEHRVLRQLRGQATGEARRA